METREAEVAEGRPVTKENDVESNTQPAQSDKKVSQGFHGVRERARRNKQERFTALLHHVTPILLRDSFYALKRNAAAGVDGMTWKEYETGLESAVETERRQQRDGEGLGTQVPGLSTGSQGADRDSTGKPGEIQGKGSRDVGRSPESHQQSTA